MSALPIPQLAVASESEIRELLLAYRRQNWRGIQEPQWQERIVDDLLRDDGEQILQQVGAFCDLPRNARVLDVGSGVGSFVTACRKRGLQAFGVEPDRIGGGSQLTSIQIARLRVEEPVFSAAVGEHLPFPDRSFDLVTLNQVIEHVADQTAVLCEAARVLREGGALYVACPNYLRFFEPHYKLFWLPLLPKALGRIYLKLRGRDPVLLEQLTYTTRARLRKLCDAIGRDFIVVDLHRELFLKKVGANSFASRRARAIARLVRVPLLGRFILGCALFVDQVTEGGCEMLVLRRDRPLRQAC